MAELLTVESLLTLTGMAAIIALWIQLIKRVLPDFRWTNVVAIALGLVMGLVATWIAKGLSARTVLDAILLALVAGCASSGIYETITNLRGLAGVGPRSDSEMID